MTRRHYEKWLVFIIIGIVFIIISKYIFNIIDNSNKQGAETQTRTIMMTMEQIYLESVMKKTDELPLIVTFKDGEAYLKAGNPAKTFIYNGNVKHAGNYPDDGELVMTKSGKIIANNIKIRNYICNTGRYEEVFCEKA